jgi:hypothetical protein
MIMTAIDDSESHCDSKSRRTKEKACRKRLSPERGSTAAGGQNANPIHLSLYCGIESVA